MALPYLQPGSASWPPISDAPERVGQSDDVLAKDRSVKEVLDHLIYSTAKAVIEPVRDLVSLDFFTVPTARLRVLFVLVVLAHYRRRVVHFNVTEHPTAHWTAQQIVDAFPDDSAPAYLLRDRDQVYGEQFRHRVKGMRIEEVLTAPHSPWQNPFVERLIGSVRRECLDHVVVLSERHLCRILTRYFAYYHRSRTHLSLDKNTPDTRPIARPAFGHIIIQIPEVGGLHHRYERRAA